MNYELNVNCCSVLVAIDVNLQVRAYSQLDTTFMKYYYKMLQYKNLMNRTRTQWHPSAPMICFQTMIHAPVHYRSLRNATLS